ncbi:O-antigen ligase family protein [Halomonas sediminis]
MTCLNNIWVLLFGALLIGVPWGYAVIPLLAGGSLLLWLGMRPRSIRRLQCLDRDDAWLCLALLVFGGVWLADVGRSGHWPVGQGNQGVMLPLWPLLAAAFLAGLRLRPLTPGVLWAAVSLGALGAGSIALYERLIIGHARAANGMNAIPFGNLSLLLGGLSFIGALWCMRGAKIQHKSLLALTLVAGLAGMLGSLLSGTRGGWIAAPLLLWVIYRAAREVLSLACLHRLAAGMLVLLIAVVVVPQSGVRDRVALAVSNVEAYWTQDVRGTSVGLRLEMWRAGGSLFVERPWLGWGEGALEVARDKLVAEGRLHPGISQHDQLHSDLIDTAARRGSLGLLSLLLLYGVPIGLFWKHLRAPGAGAEIRLLAAAGMMVPVAFIDFGLTQSMLRDARGLSGYLGLLVICWTVFRQAQVSAPDAALRRGSATWLSKRCTG